MKRRPKGVRDLTSPFYASTSEGIVAAAYDAFWQRRGVVPSPSVNLDDLEDDPQVVFRLLLDSQEGPYKTLRGRREW